MDPKELKKLLEKLKKDQGALAKGQGQLKEDIKKFEALQKILVEAQEALAKDHGNLAEEYKSLTEGQELLVDDRAALESEKERLGPLSVIEPVEKEKFNPKWLKDLVFRGRKEGKPIDKPGRKTKVKTFIPFERPMTVADVLSFRVSGNEVVFVTADGRKRTAKK